MAEQEVKQANVLLANIRENTDALRPVDKDSEEFLSLVESIKVKGILNPISVREVPPAPDGSKQVAADGTPLYALIDGLHRFTGAKAAGLTHIPVIVKDFDDAQVYEAQIVANVHKKETRPAEYAKAIQRIMGLYPTRTIAQQAAMLGKNPSWLKSILGLGQLTAEIQALVNDGKINQANAFPLSRLPQSEQPDWVERAMTQKADEFVPSCQARVKQVREDNRAGRAASPQVFTPVAHCRKFAEIKEEADGKGKRLLTVLTAKGIDNPADVVDFVLKWVTNMDEDTLNAKKAEWEGKEKKKKEDAEKRAKEKADKKGKDAEAAAAAAKKAQEDAIAAAKANAATATV